MNKSKKLEDFSKRLAKKSFQNNFFLSCIFELTYRCNLKCIHCFNQGINTQELGYKEICNIIDKLVEQGCLYLLFTGGEPLLRDDFLDIYIYAKKRGAIITLYTNGTLIDKEVMEVLTEYPPRMLEISLYGITKETHETITQIAGSFEATIQGISLLKSAGIRFDLKTMVMKNNKHELWEIKRFAEEELEVDYRYDPGILSRIDGNKNNLHVRLTPEEFFELEKKDQKRLIQFKKQWELQNKYYTNKDKVYVCSGGKWSCGINPEGKLKICIFSSEGYDLKEGTIKEARKKNFPHILDKTWDGESPCKNCNLSSLCGTCPEKAKLETGNITSPVKYLCKLGHLRAKYLDII